MIVHKWIALLHLSFSQIPGLDNFELVLEKNCQGGRWWQKIKILSEGVKKMKCCFMDDDTEDMMHVLLFFPQVVDLPADIHTKKL